LLLPCAQLGRLMVKPLAEAYHLKQLLRLLQPLVPRCSGECCGQRYILKRRQDDNEVETLEDVANPPASEPGQTV
jgi:hypothetical protein